MVSVYKGPSADEVKEQARGLALDLIGAESLEADVPLMEAGLDSLAAVEFQSTLSKQFSGVAMPSTLMFDMPSIQQISDFVFSNLQEKLTVVEGVGGRGEDE